MKYWLKYIWTKPKLKKIIRIRNVKKKKMKYWLKYIWTKPKLKKIVRIRNVKKNDWLKYIWTKPKLKKVIDNKSNQFFYLRLKIKKLSTKVILYIYIKY